MDTEVRGRDTKRRDIVLYLNWLQSGTGSQLKPFYIIVKSHSVINPTIIKYIISMAYHRYLAGHN